MRSVASLTLAISSLLATFLVVPAAATTGGKAQLDSTERAIVRTVNRHRARGGLAAVRPSRGLSRAADYHSWEMLDADYFAHTSRDGGAFEQRVRRFAGHRRILLSSSYRRIGVGKRTGSLGGRRACMVTADFGSRR